MLMLGGYGAEGECKHVLADDVLDVHMSRREAGGIQSGNYCTG